MLLYLFVAGSQRYLTSVPKSKSCSVLFVWSHLCVLLGGPGAYNAL